MSKKRSQLSILLGPLKQSSTAKAHVFSSYPCQLLRRKGEVVSKFCFVIWVWRSRRNTTVFSMAAGELSECLVELRARIFVHSSEIIRPAEPFVPSQVVVGGVDASMEKQRFGSRSSARSLKNSTNVSSLQWRFTSTCHRDVVLVLQAPSILAV